VVAFDRLSEMRGRAIRTTVAGDRRRRDEGDTASVVGGNRIRENGEVGWLDGRGGGGGSTVVVKYSAVGVLTHRITPWILCSDN
jgi:hypothetical protein